MTVAIESVPASVRRQDDVQEVFSREVAPALRLPVETIDHAEKLTSYTFIEFSLPYEAKVTLALYDQFGQEVGMAVLDKSLPAGTHQVTFSPTECNGAPSFYRLVVRGEAKVYVEVKRLH